jgi:cell division septum initiation protein DivIVA
MGLVVCDWKFADCQVEVVPPEEVVTREHLNICSNDLEDLLFETEEMQPKEPIKELEKDLARLKMEIKGRSRTCQNPRTGQPTSIPGRDTQEEQRIVSHLSWEIT